MISINTHFDEINGTHLQAYISDEMSTDQISEILGEPDRSTSEDKVTREWVIFDTDTNVVATIYDWKQYREYDDDEKVCWHIGGHDKQSVELVNDLLSGKTKVLN